MQKRSSAEFLRPLFSRRDKEKENKRKREEETMYCSPCDADGNMVPPYGRSAPGSGLVVSDLPPPPLSQRHFSNSNTAVQPQAPAGGSGGLLAVNPNGDVVSPRHRRGDQRRAPPPPPPRGRAGQQQQQMAAGQHSGHFVRPLSGGGGTRTGPSFLSDDGSEGSGSQSSGMIREQIAAAAVEEGQRRRRSRSRSIGPSLRQLAGKRPPTEGRAVAGGGSYLPRSLSVDKSGQRRGKSQTRGGNSHNNTANGGESSSEQQSSASTTSRTAQQLRAEDAARAAHEDMSKKATSVCADVYSYLSELDARSAEARSGRNLRRRDSATGVSGNEAGGNSGDRPQHAAPTSSDRRQPQHQHPSHFTAPLANPRPTSSAGGGDGGLGGNNSGGGDQQHAGDRGRQPQHRPSPHFT